MYERLTRSGVGGSIGLVSTATLGVAVGFAYSEGATALAIVGTMAFLSMAVAAGIGSLAGTRRPLALVWGYGTAAGAMVTSAALFLLPQALGQDPQFGGLGVAVGLLVGYTGHVLGHRLSHLQSPGRRAITALTAHAVAAGTVIGVIYGNLAIGPVLGLAIVSHKGPAGYAAATRHEGDWRLVLVPAAALGIAGVAASTLALPADAPTRGIVFGFATGLFLHVATDFLPSCEIGSEVHDALGDDDHATLDRLRLQAVVATAVGGVVVVLAWLTIA